MKQVKEEGKYIEKFKINIKREQIEDPWTIHKVGVIKPEIKKDE